MASSHGARSGGLGPGGGVMLYPFWQTLATHPVYLPQGTKPQSGGAPLFLFKREDLRDD
jgi:hypothetical protein